MTPPTGAKQAGGAPLPDCPATPLLTLSRRLLLSPRTSRACNSQGMTGVVWWRTQQAGGAPLPDCRAPPLLFLSPQSRFPPSSPACASQVWSGGALSRREVCLPLFAALPPFSSYHPNPCLTAPLDPPSLPVTPTPLPPPIPYMRPPGVVWWRTQQAGGAPLPVCRTPPLLFLSPQSRFPPSSPACASQGRSGAALSRWEARLCLTAPLDPPSHPITPTPLPPPIPRMRPPRVVWWRTQQVGGAPLPDCRAPLLLYLSPQSRRSPSPCTLPPLSPAHPPFRGGSHMTLVAHSADGYVECLF
ncbi:unnamed protein product [Closterium sp. NIES-65]|nr:unnamed protein product [Closterium sp. NIES-65]